MRWEGGRKRRGGFEALGKGGGGGGERWNGAGGKEVSVTELHEVVKESTGTIKKGVCVCKMEY